MEEDPDNPTLTAAEVEEEMQRLEEGLASASEMRKSVLDFITKDPKYTSAVVRKWLREKATV